MRLVFLGPPGAGKGTQAAMVSEERGIPHISTGDMFRAAVEKGTETGKKVKQYLDGGQLVPDEVVIEVLSARLGRGDCENGFLLDGFPRTLGQAEAVDALLRERGELLDLALYFDAPEEVVVERLSGRRICRSCGKNYHRKFMPPRREGVCDACGGELYQREDDEPETVRRRMRVYLRETRPVVDHYRGASRLVRIAADAPVEKVREEVKRQLRSASGPDAGREAAR